MLVVTDTDASAFAGIAAPFVTLNSGVLLLLCCRPSERVSASEALCTTASGSFGCVYSDIIGTGRDCVGTISRVMGRILLKNLSMNDVRTSTGMVRLSTTPKSTRKCRLPYWTRSVTLPKTWTGLFKVDLVDMLCIGRT